MSHLSVRTIRVMCALRRWLAWIERSHNLVYRAGVRRVVKLKGQWRRTRDVTKQRRALVAKDNCGYLGEHRRRRGFERGAKYVGEQRRCREQRRWREQD